MYNFGVGILRCLCSVFERVAMMSVVETAMCFWGWKLPEGLQNLKECSTRVLLCFTHAPNHE